MKIYRIVLALLPFWIVMSCSFEAYLYIINESQYPCTLTVVLENTVQDFESRNNFNGILPYIDDLKIKIDDHINDRLTKQLKYKVLNKYTIEAILPPTSTVFFGSESNKPIKAKSLTFNSQYKKLILTKGNLSMKLKRLGGLFHRYPVRFSITFK